jgi:hypothetical protein
MFYSSFSYIEILEIQKIYMTAIQFTPVLSQKEKHKTFTGKCGISPRLPLIAFIYLFNVRPSGSVLKRHDT